MINIGHRGASGYVAENTLASFEKALNLGVDAVELDVHLSADGVLVVIHDPTLDRTTNGSGLVADFSVSELKMFEIESQYTIPTLTEVLDLIEKRCLVHIELKAKDTPKAVAVLISNSILTNNWGYDHFIVSSFEWDLLEEIKALDAKINCGVLTEENLESAVIFAQKIKARSIHPDFRMLTVQTIKLIKDLGFEVFTWTVNAPENIKKMRNLGVDGIFCDYPDRI